MAMLIINGQAIKDPSVFEFGLHDISSSASGRALDASMHKERVAQKRELSLTWWNVSWADAAAILQATNAVYMDVSYPDALSGKTEIRTFYRDDPSAPVRIWTDGQKKYSTVSFKLIER